MAGPVAVAVGGPARPRALLVKKTVRASMGHTSMEKGAGAPVMGGPEVTVLSG